MKEKIYKYLLEKESLTPVEILEKYFFSFNTSISQADKIVDSLLINDSRFIKNEEGRWSIKRQPEKQSLKDIAFSIIEFKTITIERKKELPILLGVALVKNFTTIFKKIYTVDIPIKISEQIQKIRTAMINGEKIEANFLNNMDLICRELPNSVLVNRLCPLRMFIKK